MGSGSRESVIVRNAVKVSPSESCRVSIRPTSEPLLSPVDQKLKRACSVLALDRLVSCRSIASRSLDSRIS